MRLLMDVQMFDHPEEVPEVREFVVRNTPFALCAGIHGSMPLQACLENCFERITLVDKGMKERVTIDRGIAFHNRVTGWDADLMGLLVIEVKHEAGTPMSEMERTLHEMHVQPQRMSKYCIGTALTNPAAKKNRFKPMMLYIDNLKSLTIT